MSPRAWFYSITAGLIIDSILAAWYFDNGPMLLLGFFAALVWIWGAAGAGDGGGRRVPPRRSDLRV